METEKQIDEMAKAVCVNCTSEVCASGRCAYQYDCPLSMETIKRLHLKGYRKASEVVEEVINTALSKIQIMISAIKAQEESGNVTEFNGGAKTSLEIVFKDLAELKKKYTGEGK